MISPPSHHRGFSLIELMCSMAIGAIILLTAASLLGTSGDGYGRVGGGVAAEREARAVMTQISSDLSTARFHESTLIEESSAAWRSDRLGFLSLQPAEAQTDKNRIGDLCAVNYYLKDLTISGRTVRCLMRGFRESAPTFKALETNTVASLFEALDGIDEPVAFGVVSFQASPKSLNAAGEWVPWLKKEDGPGPAAFDVRLVVARPDLVGKLRTPEDWDGTGPKGKLLGTPAELRRNKNLEVYGTVVRFGNHANPLPPPTP
jgi:prepilin-type N-terminal cleavage/methylation domain-containing protein